MKTKHWNITNSQKIEASIIVEVATLLRAGETVAFPTETVYGLGADATNEAAIAKIFTAKSRPQDNPLIAHVANKRQLKALVDNMPFYVEKLVERFSPGPLTYILPSNGTCASNVTAGLETVAIRIPDHPIAIEILEEVDRPIAAPSANLSGKPSPTTAAHVKEDLNGRIAGIVDGGSTGVGLESTVILCRESDVVILRPGAITKADLEKFVPVAEITDQQSEKPASPGMKYRHYAPDVPLWLVEGKVKAIQQLIDEQRTSGQRVAFLGTNSMTKSIEADSYFPLGEEIEAIATNLYQALREVKAEKVDLIIAESYAGDGLAEAVMNRLKKAATKQVKLPD